MVTWRLRHAVRRVGPLRIAAYRGYGPPDAVTFHGRVLAGAAPTTAQQGESRRDAFARMARRFLSREVADVDVEVRVHGLVARAVTDREGYFVAALDARLLDPRPGAWVAGEAVVVNAPALGPVPIESLALGSAVRRVLISDIDDTVLENAAGDVARTVWTTLTSSALTRDPIEGMPELYRRLVAGPVAGEVDGPGRSSRCPTVYVSSSPWNIHDFLVAFLERHDFPHGPLLLRDLGLNRSTLGSSAHSGHKVDRIAAIMNACPNALAVLIGDSSQEDAAAYAQVIRSHPGRVAAAFIRDVGDVDKAAGVERIVAELGPHESVMMRFEHPAEVTDALAATAWSAGEE